jgi:PD-(D/E)XK nuclease superfamily protein
MSRNKMSRSKKTRKSPTPKPNPKPRPNTKRTGERSEASFLARALHLEFAVAKPWGDSQRYDFILDNGARLWRIQTKCTEGLRADAYETRATYDINGQHIPYTRADIDYIAAHVVPLDVWYIIPVEVCTPQPMLRMYPHRQARKMRLENYRNAWFLLKLMESPEDGPITIKAVAEEEEAVQSKFGEEKCGAGTPARELPTLLLLQVTWMDLS